MTQGFATKLLTRVGSMLFGFLSRCEERKMLPQVSRWLKFTLLGLGVTLIAACAKKPGIDQTFVTCYEPVAVYPEITKITVKPNPTAGADSVTVTAKAQVVNPSGLDQIISSAQCIVKGDTVEMAAQDGKLDDAYEDLISRIYVGDLERGTIEVKVTANSSYGGCDEDSTTLRISK